MNSRKKVCVILGAGASHGVHGPGSRLKSETWAPPLAGDLFNIQGHPEYAQVLARYPGAEFLAQQLADNKLRGTSLEEALRELAFHNDESIRDLFRQIPGYIRDLIIECTQRHTTVPSNYIILVKTLLADSPHEVLFLTLNYDTLLEIALSKYSTSTYKFTTIDHYIEEARAAKVVKLHGSTDWFRILNGKISRPWLDLILTIDIYDRLRDQDIVVQSTIDPSSSASLDNWRLYPYLTAPLAGKSEEMMVCPKSHVDYARAFLEDCNKFLIIGCSGLDEDLLGILSRSLERHRIIFAEFVGVDQRLVDESHTHFVKFVPSFKPVKAASIVRRLYGGFATYVASVEFAQFASVDY